MNKQTELFTDEQLTTEVEVEVEVEHKPNLIIPFMYAWPEHRRGGWAAHHNQARLIPGFLKMRPSERMELMRQHCYAPMMGKDIQPKLPRTPGAA